LYVLSPCKPTKNLPWASYLTTDSTIIAF
jgi:hypothetical protein